METRLSRWCDGLLEAGWLVAMLAIPLFYNIHSERVFEPDKLALLRTLTLIMAAVWVVRFIDRREWRDRDQWRFRNRESIWHRPLVLPVLALVTVYILATLFSITPRISLLGSYQRLQGTYTTLSYIVIFALMAGTIRTAEQVRRVVTVAIVTSIPVALYGVVQHFGQDPLPWGGNVQARVAGHMGNAIFIAAYLIMVVPLTVARIVEAFSSILADEKLAAADVARASAYIFILAIQLLTIYWSGSRGPLIGLAVGLFSFVLILLVSLRGAAGQSRGRRALPALLFLLPSLAALVLSPVVVNVAGPLAALAFFMGVVALSVAALFVLVGLRRGWRWLWLAWILLTVLMAGWLLLFNVPAGRTAGLHGVPVVGGVFDVLDEWRELPTIGSYGRMLDPTNTEGREKSGRVRVLIWQGVVDLIGFHEPLQFPDGRTDAFNWLRPVLGYGPEAMYVAFNRFYPAELATVEARNASPDRSHNETFDTLVITGALGLLAWQVLYFSVVLFALRYLGVVHSRRDAWVLGGLWFGGALAAGVVALLLAGPIYLGVAVPTGVIVGVVLYLIYYALFGRATDDETGKAALPFAPDRLLMNGLLAAVLAHYVEIHFGIAISATRLYFFAYVAVMIALSRVAAVRPAAPEAAPPAPAPTRSERKRRRAATAAAPVAPAPAGVWNTLLVPALLLTLMLGILGYNFTTYALPPGKTISGPADLTAGEIFRQALLQNARADFIDAPFILSMIVMAWLLAWLVFLSEMVKHGELRPPRHVDAPRTRRLAAAGVLLALTLAGIFARFIAPADDLIAALGKNLAILGAGACASAAVLLLLERPVGRWAGGLVGGGLLLLALPALVAGGLLPAVIMAVGGAAVMWLLWDKRWGDSLLPALGAMAGSLAAGFLVIFLHAVRYRAVLFYSGPAVDGTAQLRAAEAAQTGALLAGFYVFVVVILLLLAFALSWPWLTARRPAATRPALAYGALAVLLFGALALAAVSNVRVVQADMVYKRARPLDDQATRATGAELEARIQAWDSAIAVYERAVERAPTEDFYYLFLGRALLERASLTADAAEQEAFLTRAERLLQQAQAINPLNTDHTANLARLYTRWFVASDDTEDQQRYVELAEQNYQDALALSPQNSIVRNEYARLLLEVKGSCEDALAVYEESANIDPYYAQTHLARADAYVVCGSVLPEAEQNDFFQRAAASLTQALEIDSNNVRAWIQLAEILRQQGELDAATTALEQARARNEPARIPTAELDFIAAQIAAAQGDSEEARRLALQALATAEPETATLIEDLLAELDG